MDLIAGALSRAYPEAQTEDARADMRKFAKSLANNYPAIAAAFGQPSPMTTGARYGHGVKVGELPQLHRAMKGFAARVGMALYRDHTGTPVPTGTAIAARWYSNYELDSSETIEKLLIELGLPATLKMGRQHVQDQFRCWGATAADKPEMFVGFAAFREAFGTLAVIGADVPDEPNPNLFYPGFLRDFAL